MHTALSFNPAYLGSFANKFAIRIGSIMNLSSIFLEQLEDNYEEANIEKAMEEVNHEFLSKSAIDDAELRDFWDVAKEFQPMKILENNSSYSRLRKDLQDMF